MFSIALRAISLIKGCDRVAEESPHASADAWGAESGESRRRAASAPKHRPRAKFDHGSAGTSLRSVDDDRLPADHYVFGLASGMPAAASSSFRFASDTNLAHHTPLSAVRSFGFLAHSV